MAETDFSADDFDVDDFDSDDDDLESAAGFVSLDDFVDESLDDAAAPLVAGGAAEVDAASGSAPGVVFLA